MPSGNVSRGTETSEYLALTLALDEVDNLDGGLRDVGHILAMRELTEERRGTDDDIDTVNTYRACLSVRRFMVMRAAQNIPVSTAIRASSIWHRMCVRILALRPSLQISSQSGQRDWLIPILHIRPW